ncbi:MAG: hypothetical protein ACWGHH_00035 [Sulfurovaceae bacterium]
MSLIFVGYDTQKVYFNDFKQTKDIKTIKSKSHIVDDGIFAISDSAITTNEGKKTLLTGFRKIYDITAQLWEPSFSPGGDFAGYHNIHSRYKLIVGFVGSTLVAQHILNGITGHLEHLEISCKERLPNLLQEIEYIVNLPCEYNVLANRRILTIWDETTFTRVDFKELITGEFLANSIEHSINASIKSAREHRLDENEFKQMFTDFFCGVYCPTAMEHQVYIFRMKAKEENGIMIAYTEKEKLPKDEIAVLGMRVDFERIAKNVFSKAIKNGESPIIALENCMSDCIDKVHKRGSSEIDKPIISKKLYHGLITKKNI